MTRETKVGLLVGMGVILLVGIIISDTLSSSDREVASLGNFANQSQQEIRAADQTAPPAHADLSAPRQPRAERQRPIPEPDRTQAANAGMLTGFSNQVTQRQQNVPDWMIEEQRWRPQDEQPEAEPDTQSTDDRAQTLSHRVDEGESLYAIAARYYGNGSHWEALAEHNADVVGANGSVRAGVELEIPHNASLSLLDDFVPAGTERTARVDHLANRESQTSTPARTITVNAGDSLSSLAREHLGSAGRYQELYEANRDQLSSPDNITEGMQLRLP